MKEYRDDLAKTKMAIFVYEKQLEEFNGSALLTRLYLLKELERYIKRVIYLEEQLIEMQSDWGKTIAGTTYEED